MAISTQPYKGTRDFYPEQKRLQDYIFTIWRQVAESFGYEQYNAPIIESLELYLAKTSEEIVNEQTYAFTDRGGRQVTLRPEMTPTVSRMIAGRRQEIAFPARWFSIPNLWRYERPQRGRLREHWQLNVDLFGVSGPAAEHELILLADTIMQKFGAQRDMYSIRLNSRKLVNFVLSEILDLEDTLITQTIRLIDRMHKMDKTDFCKALEEIINSKKTEQLSEILHTKNINDLPEDIKSHPSVKELHDLEVMLARSKITNASFDITLMRGFDYYTDIVFEIFDNNPQNNRSMFGGGRYDGLVGQFGVEPISTVGFGMGDVVLQDFLEVHGLLPKLETSVDIDVILIGDVYAAAQQLVKDLRDAGLRTAVDSSGRKMEKQIKSAVKAGYPYVLFVGQAELDEGLYNLKDLKTSQEDRLNIKEIIDRFMPA